MTDSQGSGSQMSSNSYLTAANATGLPDNFAAKAREALALVKGWRGDLPSLIEALRRQRSGGASPSKPHASETPRPTLFSDLSDEALRQLMTRQPTTWKIG